MIGPLSTRLWAESYHPFSVNAEIFQPGGADDAFKKDLDDAAAIINAAGPATSERTETYRAVGVSGAFFFPPRQGWKLGLSAGYVAGPRIKQELSYGAVPGLAAGQVDLKEDLSFYRFMGEVQEQLPVGRGVAFCLGGGAGIAFGNVTQDASPSGSAASFIGASRTNEHWNGVTWMVSPALVFTSNSGLDVEAGLRYSGFPTKNESDNIAKVKFTPLSFYLGLRFGRSASAMAAS